VEPPPPLPKEDVLGLNGKAAAFPKHNLYPEKRDQGAQERQKRGWGKEALPVKMWGTAL